MNSILRPSHYLLIAGLMTTAVLPSIAQTNITPSTKKKVLIWKEEFNYKGLPDSTKWDYETGFVRNKEKQYYTKARIENAYVTKGNLVIESKREKYKDADYTSASINTLGKQHFSGDFRIEIRAKLPFGKGIWPALWMMGSNRPQVGWPKCVEFDIMEFVGHTPNTVYGTLHWWDSEAVKPNTHKSKGNNVKLDDIHEKYHVYGLEREGDKVTVFIDNNYYFSMSAPATAYKDSFTSPVYLLINTAIGGTWGGNIDDSIFPQKFYVDYVRVFQLK